MRRISNLLRRCSTHYGGMVVALMGASAVVLFAAGYWLTTVGLYRTVNQTVLEQLMLLSHRPPSMLAFMVSSRLADEKRIVTAVGLFSPDGHLIVGNIGAVPKGVPLDARVHGGRLALSGGQPAGPAHIAGKRLADGRILVVGRDVSDIARIQDMLLQMLLWCLVPALAISLATGWFAGLHTRRRLARLQASALSLTAGQLAERFSAQEDGGALDQIAFIMNGVLDHIEDLVGVLQSEGQVIAHDIRTPLTAVRARLERARAVQEMPVQAAALIDGALERLDRALAIIAAMLRIAEIDQARRRAAFAALDLASIVRDAAEAYLPVAEDRGVTLTTETEGIWPAHGDRDLLIEALANLLDNALKFTPAGGSVRIALRGTAAKPVIRVADTGPGIPVFERPLVLRRYYRGDHGHTSNGVGLGLSMVGAVMALHGFHLEVCDGTPGCVIDLLCWVSSRAAAPLAAN